MIMPIFRRLLLVLLTSLPIFIQAQNSDHSDAERAPTSIEAATQIHSMGFGLYITNKM